MLNRIGYNMVSTAVEVIISITNGYYCYDPSYTSYKY